MKKSMVFILSVFFISTFADAQITVMPYVQGGFSSIKEKPKVFSTSLSYTSDLDYTSGFGYAAGLLLNYKFSNKIEVRTGIEYQSTGIEIEEILVDNEPNHLVIYNYTGIGVVDKTKSKINAIYMNIPIQIQYNFGTEKKIVPYIALGGNLSWYMKDNFSTEGFLDNEFVGKTDGEFDSDNIFFAGLNLDFGIQRKVNEKLSFNAFISGDMYLSRFGKYATVGLYYKPFNVSLGIGLAYSIDYKK